jgi:hypothetical protein
MSYFTRQEWASKPSILIAKAIEGIESPWDNVEDILAEFYTIARQQGYDDGYKAGQKAKE